MRFFVRKDCLCLFYVLTADWRHLYKIRSNDHTKVSPWLLLALLTSPVVKRQIRSKQFTQDIIDTLGKRINELVLPFPKNQSKQDEIIDNVKAVFSRRNEAKEIMRISR